MNRPANTRGTSKLELAIIIRYTNPRLEATVSEITVPTNARVAATFSEAKKYGMVRGRPTFHRISNFVARSVFITSCSSGSVAARPVATFTTMGKMHMIIAVSTAGTVPAPHHNTKIGTTATFGIEENPTSSG